MTTAGAGSLRRPRIPPADRGNVGRGRAPDPGGPQGGRTAMPTPRPASVGLSEELRALVPPSPSGLVIRYGALARRLGVSEDQVRTAVRRLRQDGHLEVAPAGRAGVRLRRSGAPARVRGRSVTRFCPWCGAARAAAWRYCARCGASLPAEDHLTRPRSRRPPAAAP